LFAANNHKFVLMAWICFLAISTFHDMFCAAQGFGVRNRDTDQPAAAAWPIGASWRVGAWRVERQ
jgi:hypothetical protein